MRHKRNRKPTNKDFQRAIGELRYQLMTTQSQLHSLTEIFSNFLDFTHNKPKFMEYIKAKMEPAVSGSVKNPEVVQKELESS